MNLFEYALRAYNLLLDLVLMILGVFVGPLRYALIVGLLLLIGAGVATCVSLRRRRRNPRP